MKNIPIFKLEFDKKFQNRYNNLSKKIFNSKSLSEGMFVSNFEKKFSKFVHAKYSIAVSNGTAALEIAFRTINISNKEVIVPTNTFFATIIAIIKAGGKPVFCDNKPNSPEMDIKEIKNKITKKTKAICIVHVGGIISNDCSNIVKICKKKKIYLIEDAAHAHGSFLNKDLYAGTIGDIGCFSFYPTKVMTTGEGGMITTNSKEIYKKLLKLRSHGMNKDKNDFLNKDIAFDKDGKPNVWYYEITELGFNYRITDMQSALGESQLKKVDKFIKIRRKIAKTYNDGFAKNKLIKTPAETSNVKHAYHLYTILIDFKNLRKSRNQIMNELKKNNIGTQVLYIPIYQQPYYSKKYGYKKVDFPAAEKYYEKCLSIPIFPGLKKNEVNYVIKKINSIISIK